MKFNLLSGSGPTDTFRNDLELLLSLEDAELAKIAKWIQKHRKNTQFSWSQLNSLSAGLRTDPEQLGRLIFFIRFVLSNWESKGLTFREIAHDFRSIAQPRDDIESRLSSVEEFFCALENVRVDVQASYLTGIYERLGLPTVDDINLTWDIRPVFQDYAYSPEGVGDPAKLLDHSFVLIIELVATRSDGKNETNSYQFSVAEFQMLRKAFERAQTQLAILEKQYQRVGE